MAEALKRIQSESHRVAEKVRNVSEGLLSGGWMFDDADWKDEIQEHFLKIYGILGESLLMIRTLADQIIDLDNRDRVCDGQPLSSRESKPTVKDADSG